MSVLVSTLCVRVIWFSFRALVRGKDPRTCFRRGSLARVVAVERNPRQLLERVFTHFGRGLFQ